MVTSLINSHYVRLKTNSGSDEEEEEEEEEEEDDDDDDDDDYKEKEQLKWNLAVTSVAHAKDM